MTFFLGVLAGVVLGAAGALSFLKHETDYGPCPWCEDDRARAEVEPQPKVVTRLTNRERSIEL